MKPHMRLGLAVLIVLAIAGAIPAHARYDLFRPAAAMPAGAIETGREADIRPDYSGCTIPPNIAPLNFQIVEPGVRFRVKVSCSDADSFVVASQSPSIRIPPDRWRSLLEGNRGGELHFEVCVQDDTMQWRRYEPIVNTISVEPIDPYIAYRRIGPAYVMYHHMDIDQRNLETYDVSNILQSPRGTRRCINCHTFVNNDPKKMVLHMRGTAGVAMLLGEGDQVTRINTRTEFNSSPASYISWHPSGGFASFSSHKLVQFFHSPGFIRDVFDYASDIGFYFVDDNRVFVPSKLAEKQMLEIFPTWSPDGRWLYFCRARITWPDDAREKNLTPKGFDEVRYDLMRISYDIDTNTLGEVESVLLASDFDKSILEPRVSPDGRFVLLTMCDYGNFPVYRESSDLYMLDVESGKCRPLDEVNSPRADTWHCWSTNGRWIVFASKRLDNVFGKPFFSYVDENGNARKPFLLPQEDPAFYDSYLSNYNAPEFITGPVTIPEEAFKEAIADPDSELEVLAESDMAPDDARRQKPGTKATGDSMWRAE